MITQISIVAAVCAAASLFYIEDLALFKTLQEVGSTKRKSRINPPRLTGLRFLNKDNRISVVCAQRHPFYKDLLTHMCV